MILKNVLRKLFKEQRETAGIILENLQVSLLNSFLSAAKSNNNFQKLKYA